MRMVPRRVCVCILIGFDFMRYDFIDGRVLRASVKGKQCDQQI